MLKTVIALASSLPPGGVVPNEIVYIPEGDNLIYPQSHPEGVLVKLAPEKGPSIAAAFNLKLEKLGKENVKPRLDFKHEAAGPTSGFPKGFRYEAGRGLLCSVDWSGAGRSAIEGRDFAYFSPRFDIDENGVPSDLPNRGPLGALVNEPAFREIERIAASDAGTQPKPPVMDLTILATCGLLTESEAARETAVQIATKRVAAMKGDATELETSNGRIKALEEENAALKKKVTAAEDAAKATSEKAADDLVAAAVADGRILPTDEEKKKGFRERIIAGDAFSIQILKDLPKVHEGIEKPIIEGGAADAERPVNASAKFKDLKGGDLLEAALAAETKK